MGNGVATADELHAISFIGDFSDLRPMHGHQVQHPGRLLALGAGPASTEDCSLPADDLGLHKEIAERRMQCVRGRRCQNHFRVTGNVYRTAYPRAIGNADATQFDVILGRNSDLGMGVIVVVASAKLGSPFREDRLKMLRSFERWLICG